MKTTMKNVIQAISFLLLLFVFSISLPAIFSSVYGDITPSRDLVSRTKERVEFQSRNSLYTIEAMDKDRWAYFSFSKGRTVDIKDHTYLDWDIAFNRANFISNGGATNQKGIVGIINLGRVDIDSVYLAPETGYVQDSSWFGLNRNKELNKWYIYRTKNHRLDSKGDVYVIRTIDGKYAKMRIIDYYCEGGESACITIEYFYQPDATRNLKNLSEAVDVKTISFQP